MARYESSVKQIPHPQGSVFAKLSDLNNLAAVREKFSDPDAQAALQGKLTGEQVEAARRQLESMEFTADTVSFSVPMMGGVSIRVVEREPDKCVKLESVSSPIPLKLWIQILPTTEAASKLKLTLDASLNPFIRAMADKPLREGVEKLADMLAMIPYDA